MGVECAYSFWDLFVSAYKREATDEEKQEFFKMTQDERNTLVKKWAEMAKWEVDERPGSDGLTYAAFAPTFSPQE